VPQTSWLPSAKQWWAERQARRRREQQEKAMRAAAKNSTERSQRALRKASAASLRDIATYKGWMHKQGKGPPLNLKPEIVFVVSE
jgi:hypothetical protein